jgi:hypothetical protein
MESIEVKKRAYGLGSDLRNCKPSDSPLALAGLKDLEESSEPGWVLYSKNSLVNSAVTS